MTRQDLLSRISIDPNVCFGRPCIRGTRIWVSLVLDFLASEENYQAIFDAEARPSAWKSIFDAASDPDTAGFNAAGVNADPMPSIPAMGFVWDAWVNAGNLTLSGELTAAEALQGAVDQVLAQAKP